MSHDARFFRQAARQASTHTHTPHLVTEVEQFTAPQPIILLFSPHHSNNTLQANRRLIPFPAGLCVCVCWCLLSKAWQASTARYLSSWQADRAHSSGVHVPVSLTSFSSLLSTTQAHGKGERAELGRPLKEKGSSPSGPKVRGVPTGNDASLQASSSGHKSGPTRQVVTLATSAYITLQRRVLATCSRRSAARGGSQLAVLLTHSAVWYGGGVVWWPGRQVLAAFLGCPTFCRFRYLRTLERVRELRLLACV